MIKRVCKNCKKIFFTFNSEIRKNGGIFCSVKCYHKSRENSISKNCLICGTSMLVVPNLRNTKKYCSNKCKFKGILGTKRSQSTINKNRRASLKQFKNGMSIKTRMKMSDSHKGNKNGSWKGGISKNPYPSVFNGGLKRKIRERDNFICCLCGRTEREELEELNQVLSVNHIDFNKNNCKESNLNTLCLRCNVKINRDREYWTNYFNKSII